MPDCGACPAESYHLRFDRLRDDSAELYTGRTVFHVEHFGHNRGALRLRGDDLARPLQDKRRGLPVRDEGSPGFRLRRSDRCPAEPPPELSSRFSRGLVLKQCSTWNTKEEAIWPCRPKETGWLRMAWLPPAPNAHPREETWLSPPGCLQ